MSTSGTLFSTNCWARTFAPVRTRLCILIDFGCSDSYVRLH
jgi:hypothetical protein